VPPIQISVNVNECRKSFKVLIWNQFPLVSFLLVNPIAIVSDPIAVMALVTAHGGKVTFARYDLTWWDDIFQCSEMLWS
jgi:hypothetical protein